MDKAIDTVMFSIVGIEDGGDLKSFSVGIPGEVLGQEENTEYQVGFHHIRSDDQVSFLEAIMWQAANLISKGDANAREELVKEFKERF